MLIVNNERLCDIYSDTPISLKTALNEADNVLKNAVKGISELITISSEGNINLDFRDVESTMRDGGGAIMAIGRASGEHRVERAIIDALDSPLLYGSDISQAKRILFNIYASEETPIMIPEMREIDDFFDQLDPNIDVIWGTSTDNSLGEDAKVIILAADMNNTINDQTEKDSHLHDEEYYEELITRLYKPMKKTPEEPMYEEAAKPEFIIKEPVPTEPAAKGIEEEPESTPENSHREETTSTPRPADQPATAVERWKNWLGKKLNDMMTDDDA